MYYYEFHFRKEVDGRLIRLSAIHIADTATLELDDSDRTDTSKFPSVDSSNTKIIFFISKEDDLTSWDHWDVDFLWKKEQRIELAKNGTLPEKSLQLGMQSMSFDLEEIFTEQGSIDVVNQLKFNFNHL